MSYLYDKIQLDITLMGLNISNIVGSAVSQFTFGIICCLICSYNVSVATHDGVIPIGGFVLTGLAVVAILVWLIWFCIKQKKGEMITPMLPSAGKVVQLINAVLFVIWLLSDNFFTTSPVWVITSWILFSVEAVYYLVYSHSHKC